VRSPDAAAASGPPVLVPDAPGILRHTDNVFGCAVEIVTAVPPAVPVPAVVDLLRALDARFSRFRADSELSRLNAAAGAWSDVSVSMYRMLEHALNVAVASRGLVNAGILPWLEAAGYVGSWPAPLSRATRRSRPAGPVPPLTGTLELQLHRARLQPGAAVDFGGLAKGRWADDVVRWLGGNASCSLGGDVACAGPGPRGDGWPVRLPDGRAVDVRDAGVATSGVGRRRWGDGAHHIIDPRTGQCADSGVERVTVLAGTATEAEWSATALVVGGLDVAARLGVHVEVLDSRVGAEH
jgi:FAD:protein FMN transferase